MSIALDIVCFSVPFTMIFAAVLSFATGVCGCDWPIYSKVTQIDVSV